MFGPNCGLIHTPLHRGHPWAMAIDKFRPKVAVVNKFNYGKKYLLLTEFGCRAVSYGPSFFPFDLWPAGFALGPKIEGKKRTEKTRLVRYLLYR